MAFSVLPCGATLFLVHFRQKTFFLLAVHAAERKRGGITWRSLVRMMQGAEKVSSCYRCHRVYWTTVVARWGVHRVRRGVTVLRDGHYRVHVGHHRWGVAKWVVRVEVTNACSCNQCCCCRVGVMRGHARMVSSRMCRASHVTMPNLVELVMRNGIAHAFLLSFLFPFHSAILKPNFHLAIAQFNRFGNLKNKRWSFWKDKDIS